ncbi:hypothetical protein ACWCQQ_36270 [Streptomyces sp. NPDC002143]
MRAHHARAAKALDARIEPGGEFWGWAGRTLGASARTAIGQLAWLRLVSSPEDKASGKLWGGALDAWYVFGDLDGHRAVFLAVLDVVVDGTACRAELSARVVHPVLSDGPVLECVLQLPESWWTDLTAALEKVSATVTDRAGRTSAVHGPGGPRVPGHPGPSRDPPDRRPRRPALG